MASLSKIYPHYIV